MNKKHEGSDEPTVDWALSRIRHYAEEHGLSPEGICEVFSRGLVASATDVQSGRDHSQSDRCDRVEPDLLDTSPEPAKVEG